MKILWLFVAFGLTACTSLPTPAERQRLADAMATARDWRAINIPAGAFNLVAYLPARHQRNETLTIYIEGDGFAWINHTQPSTDPTPRDPLALRLALAQPEGNAAYLARPCQYVDAAATGCSNRYWTEMRFAPEVIAASSHAIDVLKQQSGASNLVLVGYSGGGAVAALVAAQRPDVKQLVTVAGNLDHLAWTSYHQIQPLTGSLNPADYVEALRNIRQRHFVGGKDANITPGLVQSYALRFPKNQRPTVLVEPEFDHRCCWANPWPTLWRESQE